MSAAAVVRMPAKRAPVNPKKSRKVTSNGRAFRRKAQDETMQILVRAANHLILKDRFSHDEAMAIFQHTVLDTSIRASDGCKLRAAEQLKISREYLSKRHKHLGELLK